MVKVRLSEEEAARFRTQVRASGLSQESYLRLLIHGKVPQPLPPSEYHAMMEEISRLKGEVVRLRDDIAHLGYPSEAEHVEELRQEMIEQMRTIIAAVYRNVPAK